MNQEKREIHSKQHKEREEIQIYPCRIVNHLYRVLMHVSRSNKREIEKVNLEKFGQLEEDSKISM